MASRQSPRTETKTVSETRKDFSETLNQVYRGEIRVLVEKNGIPVGAIVSPRELEQLERIDQERRLTLEAFAAARNAFAGIPEEEIEREVWKAIAEVEEENRRARKQSEKQSA